MDIPYLNSDNFQSPDSASATTLARELETLLKNDYQGDMFTLLAGYQRILADNQQRPRWAAIHQKLATLFKCGTYRALDGPMIGVSVSIRDSDYFRETARRLGRTRSAVANIEWMASAWNMTFADTGLWMGKTFEPVDRQMVADKTEGDAATLAGYDPETSRIGRNYFREPPRPDPLQRLGLPVLTTLWGLKPRPMTTDAEGFDGHLTEENLAKEVNIPYAMTGGLFLAAPGRSVVPEMNGKAVYQLNYRWPRLGPTYPLTRLVDELVRIDEGIYLGQLVFATRHYSLGSLRLLDRPGMPAISLGDDYMGEKDDGQNTLFDLFAGDRAVDYGYQNNGYFLMLDPAFAEKIYADNAFPQLRPREGESGFVALGYDASAPARAAPSVAKVPGRWPEVTDWATGWRHHPALEEKFTTFLLEPDLPPAAIGDIKAMRRDGESILQMLQRLSRETSARTAGDDRLRHFDRFHRLFRAGIAPSVVDGCFQGHGNPGYNYRADGEVPRDWYGQTNVARDFDYYHGVNLNLHLGFRETLQSCDQPSFEENQLFPGTLASLLSDEGTAPPNVLDMVWHGIGKYIFPWAGKSFERINGRKLSMFLDESVDLAERYPERVLELKTHLASAPHYALVKKAARGHWKTPGIYAEHLASGSWDRGMRDADKAFWENEAATRWVDGNNIQDRRIVAADPLMRIIDMNYRIPDPALQAISQAGPSPFARQGYIFLGTSNRESILPINHTADRRKTVFQFHYRYPMVGGPVPIGLCLDELVEIADGLFLGQLIYATALDEPYHSSVDPAVYNYQLFGYFLLLNDAWEHHRRAIRLDMWEAP
jgi:hypothetical protein